MQYRLNQRKTIAKIYGQDTDNMHKGAFMHMKQK